MKFNKFLLLLIVTSGSVALSSDSKSDKIIDITIAQDLRWRNTLLNTSLLQIIPETQNLNSISSTSSNESLSSSSSSSLSSSSSSSSSTNNGYESFRINIDLPPSITNIDKKLKDVGSEFAKGISITTAELKKAGESVSQELKKASDGVSNTINTAMRMLKESVESGVNSVESSVNRFSNIFILKTCATIAIVMGLIAFNNDNPYKGAGFLLPGLIALFKGSDIMGAFKMHKK